MKGDEPIAAKSSWTYHQWLKLLGTDRGRLLTVTNPQ